MTRFKFVEVSEMECSKDVVKILEENVWKGTDILKILEEDLWNGTGVMKITDKDLLKGMGFVKILEENLLNVVEVAEKGQPKDLCGGCEWKDGQGERTLDILEMELRMN